MNINIFVVASEHLLKSWVPCTCESCNGTGFASSLEIIDRVKSQGLKIICSKCFNVELEKESKES